MRPVVQAECTLKESAAINQILGRRVSVENAKAMFNLYLKTVPSVTLTSKFEILYNSQPQCRC